MNSSDLENQCKIMTLFIDNAKSYIQLSGAALVLSITFIHEVLGVPAGHKLSVDGWMIAAWIAFLLAIIAGAFYQYLAVKYLERLSRTPSFEFWSWLVQQPGLIYGVMLSAFYCGALFFTIEAIVRLS